MKELKALLDLKNEALKDTNFTAHTIEELDLQEEMEKANKKIIKNYTIVETALKALVEIIKEKGVDVGFLQYCSTVETYNNYIIEHAWTKQTKKLTPEEFDLLKNIL